MRCERLPIETSDGSHAAAIVCTSGRRTRVKCSNCGAPGAERLCDGPRDNGYETVNGTCDAPVCRACALNIGPNKDLCPTHAVEQRPGVLHVQTAKLGYRGPDWLDVSLQGNMRRADEGEEGGHQGIGLFFAPSPELLYPYLSKRKFGRLTERDWTEYAAKYTAEMRHSYRRFRAAWDILLKREHVVLLCYCKEVCKCHRTVLGRDILPKLGAVYGGEVVKA